MSRWSQSRRPGGPPPRVTLSLSAFEGRDQPALLGLGLGLPSPLAALFTQAPVAPAAQVATVGPADTAPVQAPAATSLVGQLGLGDLLGGLGLTARSTSGPAASAEAPASLSLGTLPVVGGVVGSLGLGGVTLPLGGVVSGLLGTVTSVVQPVLDVPVIDEIVPAAGPANASQPTASPSPVVGSQTSVPVAESPTASPASVVTPATSVSTPAGSNTVPPTVPPAASQASNPGAVSGPSVAGPQPVQAGGVDQQPRSTPSSSLGVPIQAEPSAATGPTTPTVANAPTSLRTGTNDTASVQDSGAAQGLSASTPAGDPGRVSGAEGVGSPLASAQPETLGTAPAVRFAGPATADGGPRSALFAAAEFAEARGGDARGDIQAQATDPAPPVAEVVEASGLPFPYTAEIASLVDQFILADLPSVQEELDTFLNGLRDDALDLSADSAGRWLLNGLAGAAAFYVARLRSSRPKAQGPGRYGKLPAPERTPVV